MMKFGCNLSVFKPEKRRHLWLITGLFALVIMVHYLKFPNETIKGTLFSFQWWDSNRRNETYQMANASFSAKKEATDLKNGLALENASNAEPNQQKKTPFHPTSSTVQISIPPEMAMVSPSPLSQSVRDGTNATLVDISPRPKEVIVIKKMTSDRNISCENPMVKKMAMTQKEMGAVPFSEMKNMLFHNQSPYLLIKPLWPSIVDQELLNAKSQIENAEKIQDDDDDGLHAPLYWNVSKFKRSYELMEKTLKVYIYREGERPVFHKPDLRGIYASEGWFMKQLTTNTKYITDDPTKAHLFYLPFGSHNLQRSLYVPDSHSFANLIEYLNAYLQLIRGRYPFWNRTCGADHFLVACHDWAGCRRNKVAYGKLHKISLQCRSPRGLPIRKGRLPPRNLHAFCPRPTEESGRERPFRTELSRILCRKNAWRPPAHTPETLGEQRPRHEDLWPHEQERLREAHEEQQILHLRQRVRSEQPESRRGNFLRVCPGDRVRQLRCPVP
ncbi:unnamed protein product [Cuscuta campestris]|uniref:Exostosin GT47 domain-containing protein n=1 Tax=Cuscuta campestris TaxID=132261 RepID=A0A484M0D7_9ASTE|nr:unnamed protein product [Cuscuta campestris]